VAASRCSAGRGVGARCLDASQHYQLQNRASATAAARGAECGVLQCDVLRVLQCVAVCCCVLQLALSVVCCSVLQVVAFCCSVLPCGAVCCRVLQYVAGGTQCGVLQCVALCCRWH